MSDPFEPLRRDISDLGHTLGDTLVEHEGAPFLEMEETIRALAKERRVQGRRGPAAKKLQALIASLRTDSAARVGRAFAHYFQLVNLAEQHHRTRRRRDYARTGTPQPGSLEQEIAEIAKQLPRDRFEALLATVSIELVFTAHPSEAQRRTVLEKHRRIADLLARRERTELLPHVRDEIAATLRDEIATLWLTDEVRAVRPRVGDEVKNTLFYLEEVLFPLVPQFYAAFESAVQASYGKGVRVPSLLRFGTWVGGDMDGNPNVTPAVSLDTAYAQTARVLALYLKRLDALGAALSHSARRVTTGDALEASLARDAKDLPDLDTPEDGPYRRKLRFMTARLEALHTAVVAARPTGSDVTTSISAYTTPRALLDDLELIAQSLEANRCRSAAVRGLQRQVETFGFHLARLDVRVPSEWVREPNAWPDGAGTNALRTVSRIRALTAGAGAESFILSMSRGAGDMVCALQLAQRVGLFDPDNNRADLSIVPLFETIADLERSHTEVERAASDPLYAKYLSLRDRTQEVMIGYSDSNKEAGILASSFALYRAQQRLVQMATRNDLRLKIFHGRGGSIGRGGGPSQRAIESLPRGSVDGRFKLTEQGEVLGWKYLLSEIAERNLEFNTSGVLRACARDALPPERDVSAYEAAFEEISAESLTAYRALVEDPGFIPYYEQTTPLSEIARLNIGSRPAKRTQDGTVSATRSLDDLRAIPWVFAWTQSRQNVPGFFGAGRALTQLLRTRGLAFARTMRAEWPFFASTLDAVAVSLATADMEIAQHYVSLAEDRTAAWRLFTRVAKDHARAVRAVCAILDQPRVLAHQPTLERSIELRNPYVDPLSFIQVELLKRKRAHADVTGANKTEQSELERGVLLTLNGIAAGLRNTG